MALNYDRLGSDTIAAIATGISESGIGIIRISGPEALDIAGRLFVGKKGKADFHKIPANTLRFGYIVENDEIIDEVIISVMKAPHSYTTEDTIEINTHGGIYLMHRVLDLVLKSGARMAEPGEFTKRAFLGGRIDLSRAEAVMDLISSQNEFSRKTAAAQLTGKVSGKITELREKIIYELAFIESAIDDPENYDLDGYPEELNQKLSKIIEELTKIIEFAKDGRILKEGINTVIVGKPNAGKSSLLNYLSGHERAIVTEIAGTTRDILEEQIRIGNAVLNITDTAGIRETEDRVEQIGVERAKKAMESADLIIFVLDSSTAIENDDVEIAGLIAKQLRQGKRCIALMNKSDLHPVITQNDVMNLFRMRNVGEESTQERVNYRKMYFHTCSLSSDIGLNELKDTISQMFRTGEIAVKDEIFLSSKRHLQEAESARESLLLVQGSIENGLGEDFYSIDLMSAYTALGRILGKEVEEDLVEEIFSKFCLGK